MSVGFHEEQGAHDTQARIPILLGHSKKMTDTLQLNDAGILDQNSFRIKSVGPAMVFLEGINTPADALALAVCRFVEHHVGAQLNSDGTCSLSKDSVDLLEIDDIISLQQLGPEQLDRWRTFIAKFKPA